jgi:hypothetical protein
VGAAQSHVAKGASMLSDAIEQKLEDVIDRMPGATEVRPLIESTVQVALATARSSLPKWGRDRGRAPQPARLPRWAIPRLVHGEVSRVKIGRCSVFQLVKISNGPCVVAASRHCRRASRRAYPAAMRKQRTLARKAPARYGQPGGTRSAPYGRPAINDHFN